MEKCKVIATPISTSCNFDKDKDGKPFEESRYWGMIDSLIYPVASHLDIMFVVCMWEYFQESPKESHISASNALWDISSTQDMGLWYPKGADCDLVGNSGSDFGEWRLDGKSTNNTYNLIVNLLASWHNKKQASVVLSAVDTYTFMCVDVVLNSFGWNNKSVTTV